MSEAAFSLYFHVGGEHEAPLPCSLPGAGRAAGSMGDPSAPVYSPKPIAFHSAAETLQVSHVSQGILTHVVFSGREMEARDQRVEERVYL